MWRSGVTRRRAQDVLFEMVERAAQTGTYDAPWRATPKVWEFFRDEGEILEYLQRHWRHTLAGAIYVAIEQGEGDLRGDVMKAFAKVERKQHALRQVLEAHAEHSSIAAAMRKERALLAAFTGQSSDNAPQAA
jgi:hypothetical protein